MTQCFVVHDNLQITNFRNLTKNQFLTGRARGSYDAISLFSFVFGVLHVCPCISDARMVVISAGAADDLRVG